VNEYRTRMLHQLDAVENPDAEYVTVARHGEHGNAVLFTGAGPVRLFEGKARVPVSMARMLVVEPGWSIEP
jgi:hypothetical protein